VPPPARRTRGAMAGDAIGAVVDATAGNVMAEEDARDGAHQRAPESRPSAFALRSLVV
jgi:hypothetical protein